MISVVEHKEVMPFRKTVYDTPCLPGACRASPEYREALRMMENTQKEFPMAQPPDAFMFWGE